VVQGCGAAAARIRGRPWRTGSSASTKASRSASNWLREAIAWALSQEPIFSYRVTRCPAATRIDVTGARLEIHDLHSHNHTYVNGVWSSAPPSGPAKIRLADFDLELLKGK
jgi:hypothetical protein